MKIGVCLESLGLPLRQALQRSASMGVKGVQFDAVGDRSPKQLTDTGRRELRTLLRNHDVEITALNCPLRYGIDTIENQDARLEHIRQVMALAFELGPRLVIVPFPKISTDADSRRASALRAALLDLGRYGDRIGSSIALEIGFDAAKTIRDYLGAFECGSLGVHYDPVNMLLHDRDPVKNLLPLQGKILHTQARDARLASVNQTAAEVPVGAGDIEWMGYFGTLTAIDYRGWVVVKRDIGDNRLADVEAGVKFLRRVVVSA
jgi:L-ribulose-5-phosphate 3-epimerase